MLRKWLRKEWHDQGWKAVYGTVMLAGGTAIGLHARMMPDAIVLFMSVLIGALGFPLLVAMDVFAEDRENDTLRWQLALPCSRHRFVSIRIASAMVVALTPLLVSAAVAIPIAGGREMETQSILLIHAAGMWAAIQLLGWILALGLGARHGFTVVLIGLGVVAFWFLYTLGISMLNWHRRVLFALCPVGAIGEMSSEAFSGKSIYAETDVFLAFLTGVTVQTALLLLALGFVRYRFCSRKGGMA